MRVFLLSVSIFISVGFLRLEARETASDRVSLNGIWEVAEGDWDRLPVSYPHVVPVPGLLSLAEPGFDKVGRPDPDRECFWYKTTFEQAAEDPPEVLLRIGKAKYGTRVYLNGHRVGEYPICFSSSDFRLTPFLNPRGETNTLVIGVGAHIDSLWEPVVTGGEVEKIRYMPGIYDSVSLLKFNDGYLDHIQVAPDLEKGHLIVEGEFVSLGSEKSDTIEISLREISSGVEVLRFESEPITLQERMRTTWMTEVLVKDLTPWSPETPHLYLVRISLGGAVVEERLGWRSFHLDPDQTNRALLNGEPYYFRGTTIALFRFFEDPVCRDQPWDPEWVRKLIRKFKSLGMNSARTCISVLPSLWYDIADEEGFAFFEEYPIWYALREGVSHADFEKERKDEMRRYGIYPEGLTTARLVEEYTAWMQDLWNHPSVIAWDAQNETWAPETGEAIRQVRQLDKSNRPWDNGWSPPGAPSDFREGHQYFGRYRAGSEAANAFQLAERPFRLSDLPDKVKIPNTFYWPYQNAYGLPFDDHSDQPCILNEYGYFWLNRDGTPTTLTAAYYEAVLGSDHTESARREHYAYMLQGLTEYWRAVRTCFVVIHVFGLAHSLPPHGATCDNFVNVDSLELDPAFERAMRVAMAPVGICIEEWDDSFAGGQVLDVPVVLTNDHGEPFKEQVTLSLVHEGEVLSQTGRVIEVGPWAKGRLFLRVQLPRESGSAQLLASYSNDSQGQIFSRRQVFISEPKR